MIFDLLRRKRPERAVDGLYRRIVSAARAEALYDAYGVPDSSEGRFEALSLHLILVLRRLKSLPAPAADIAQELVDLTFRELDRSLREMGVGDISVPKRMKSLGQAFYGRVSGYEAAFNPADPQTLAAAIGKSGVVGGAGERLAAYALASERLLAALPLEDILGETHLFPDPASIEGTAP
jgi:cytochrome b pre-mRNA-processing protein 3